MALKTQCRIYTDLGMIGQLRRCIERDLKTVHRSSGKASERALSVLPSSPFSRLQDGLLHLNSSYELLILLTFINPSCRLLIK